MASPRPYVAAAAASVLAALYFVPSASATTDHAPSSAAQSRTATTTRSAHHLDLADTGAINTKPYVVGGAVFLVAGAGLIVDAGRRSRREATTA